GELPFRRQPRPRLDVAAREELQQPFRDLRDRRIRRHAAAERADDLVGGSISGTRRHASTLTSRIATRPAVLLHAKYAIEPTRPCQRARTQDAWDQCDRRDLRAPTSMARQGD